MIIEFNVRCLLTMPSFYGLIFNPNWCCFSFWCGIEIKNNSFTTRKTTQREGFVALWCVSLLNTLFASMQTSFENDVIKRRPKKRIKIGIKMLFKHQRMLPIILLIRCYLKTIVIGIISALNFSFPQRLVQRLTWTSINISPIKSIYEIVE